ncbi:hypothetical protein HDV05_004132 [Chytridiales sp. JEL 0842]|nr:hypothetical protein HDV05_004132 [Chytridiales sp. JEL 0842]
MMTEAAGGDLFNYVHTGFEEPPLEVSKQLIRRFLDLHQPPTSENLSPEIIDTFKVPGFVEAFVDEITRPESPSPSLDSDSAKTDSFDFIANLTSVHCNSRPPPVRGSRASTATQIICERSALDNNVANLLEEIIFFRTTNASSLGDQHFELVSESGIMELTLSLLSVTAYPELAIAASELFERIVERAQSLEDGYTIFKSLDTTSSSLYDIFNIISSDPVPEQLQGCLRVLHAAAIKSSGRCPQLPSQLHIAGHVPLSRLKHISFELVAENMSLFCGPKSPLFTGDEEETARLYGHSLTSFRTMALEILLEAVYGLSAINYDIYDEHSHEIHKKLDKILSKTPWSTLASWFFQRYQNATIVQGLIYKLLYFAIRKQNPVAIDILFDDQDNGNGDLVSSLLESLQTSKHLGYSALLSKSIQESAAAQTSGKNSLADKLCNNDNWKTILSMLDEVVEPLTQNNREKFISGKVKPAPMLGPQLSKLDDQMKFVQ